MSYFNGKANVSYLFLGLVEAANFLAAAVHEEKPASSSEAGPSHGEDAAGPFAYNLGKFFHALCMGCFV
jgi:hypothetical protein